MKAMVSYVVCVSLILSSTSCSHVVRAPLDREVTDHTDVEKPWLEMEGWTDRSGARHELRGYAQVTAESVLVYSRKPGSEQSSEGRLSPAAALPREDVAEVHVRRFSLLKTTAVVVIPLGVLLGAYAVGGAYSVGDELAGTYIQLRS
jgi:hypothetical protein